MAFTVVYDACALHAAPLRDLLIRIANKRLISGIELPGANDRHVVAAAIRSGAQVIVTFNLRDFPSDSLSPYNLEAQHPDDFVLNAIDLSPGTVLRALEEQSAALRNPPVDLLELLTNLQSLGLVQSVARMRELFY